MSRPYLWLTRWPPYPPRRGGDIEYSRELLHSMTAFRPVRAIAFRDGPAAPPEVPGLTWTLVEHREPPRWASLVSPLPNVAFRHLSRAYLDVALQAARDAEAIFVDFIGMFWIVEPLQRALANEERSPLIVVVNHNVEHDVRLQMVAAEPRLPMKALLAYDTWKAGRLERQANQAAHGVIANTPSDARLLARVARRPMVSIMPAYAGPRIAARTIDASTPHRISILGNHEAHHKRMVLDRALQALSAAGLQRRYEIDVVGAGDNREFEARYPGFNYRGHVEDIEAYLRTVRLGLIPDEIGGGFKVRALTHAFQRVPMLAVRSAVQGMGLSANAHYIEAEDLTDMAAMIPDVIEDTARLNSIQDQAFAHCAAAFDWSERGRSLDAFVQRLRSVAA